MLKLRNPQSLPAEPGVGLATVTAVIDIGEPKDERKTKNALKIDFRVLRAFVNQSTNEREVGEIAERVSESEGIEM